MSMTPLPTFSHEITVGDADIDQLGHASNIEYVRWIQDVAVAHSDAVGLDHAAYVNMGAVFVVVRHEVDYLRPLLRGDRLEVRTWIDSQQAAKCKRATEIRRVEDQVVVARAMTTWGFIDVARQRPTRIPPAVREAFAQPPFRASRTG